VRGIRIDAVLHEPFDELNGVRKTEEQVRHLLAEFPGHVHVELILIAKGLDDIARFFVPESVLYSGRRHRIRGAHLIPRYRRRRHIL